MDRMIDLPESALRNPASISEFRPRESRPGSACRFKRSLPFRFGDYRCSVCQNFRDPRADLVRIIPHSDHGVGSVLFGMFDHFRECVGTRLFAETGIDRDIASQNRLKPGEEISDEAARANDDSSNDAAASDNTMAGQFKCGCHVFG